MFRIEGLGPKLDPEELRRRMRRDVLTSTGFLPNVFKALSHRPAEFRAFFSCYDAVMNKDSGTAHTATSELPSPQCGKCCRGRF
ncbi:mitochondrial import receptor subunit TOM5-like protein [Patagioenas fasciata monilis]|uniref:Mitochondrial import receptor subunit TOM5-like protein n=1 Tax=Patagioenas fasciata monilis TaxID=372326 RepID=A0A1V4L261_PATFA|nr:mitochondrial import receptor subunit TOM5-like protein [Patagioenas fasciata monilis]